MSAEKVWTADGVGNPIVHLPGAAGVPWLCPLQFMTWLDMPDSPVQWLVKGLVPVASLCMLSGPRKRGYKTYLAFLISLLYAYGHKWWEWEVAEPGNVLILEEESTHAENKRRFRNLMQGLKIPEGTAPAGQIYFQLYSRFKFDDPVKVAGLKQFIKTNNIKLVIFDAFTYMMLGDPNSTRDMQIATAAMQDIRAETQCSLLWLAHTTKESEKVDADPDIDVRNSSVLLDVYDAHIAVRRKKKGKLSLFLKFKAWPEKELEGYWKLPDEMPDGSLPVGPAYLEVANVTGEKRADDIMTRLRAAGWMPGVLYKATAFQEVSGLTRGGAMELRGRMIAEKKLIANATGDMVGLPKE